MTVSDVTIDGEDAAWEYKFADTAVRVALPQPLAVGQSTVLGLNYRIEVPQSLDTGYGLLSYTNGILALDTPYAPIPVYNEEGWNVETPPENADTSFNDPSFYLVRVERARPAEARGGRRRGRTLGRRRPPGRHLRAGSRPRFLRRGQP